MLLQTYLDPLVSAPLFHTATLEGYDMALLPDSVDALPAKQALQKLDVEHEDYPHRIYVRARAGQSSSVW